MEDIEGQVADEFKNVQFTEEFVNAVVRKTREMVETNRANSTSLKQGILNQRLALEGKRNKLEDVLIDGSIERDTFKRKHAEIQAYIVGLDTKMQDIDNKNKVDIDVIEEVLAFTRNIYQAYNDAPGFLKRHYLRFFYEKLIVKNRVITEVVPTPIMATLRDNYLVIIKTNWLLDVDSDHEPSP